MSPSGVPCLLPKSSWGDWECEVCSKMLRNRSPLPGWGLSVQPPKNLSRPLVAFSHCSGIYPSGGFWPLQRCWVLAHPLCSLPPPAGQVINRWLKGGAGRVPPHPVVPGRGWGPVPSLVPALQFSL